MRLRCAKLFSYLDATSLFIAQTLNGGVIFFMEMQNLTLNVKAYVMVCLQ